METVLIEDQVLVPNGAKIKELREGQGWTLDDAYVQARIRNIPLSRMTLVDLEKSKGCRLKTLGWARALYGGTLDELTQEVAEQPKKPKSDLHPRH